MRTSRAPFTIERLDHVLLIVSGMAECVRFYEDVLGCVVESRMPQYGMVELRAGSSHLDLVDVAMSKVSGRDRPSREAATWITSRCA